MRFIFIPLLATLVGCGMFWPAVTQAESAVADKLSNPDSAQFRDIRFSKLDNFVVCGDVNAKNADGRETGFTHFVAKPGFASWQVIIDYGTLKDAERKLFDARWQGCV